MTRPSALRRLLLVLPAAALFAACAAPEPVEYVAEPSTTTTAGASLSAMTNGICPDQPFFIADAARTNFSLGAEFYRNGTQADENNVNAQRDGLCSAYPYLKWLVANDPLYTGGEPDDRNFLRLANVFEFFADQSEEEATTKAYLDSALMMRSDGMAALREAGVEFDQYARDLREGFFFFSRAFEAQPDSLPDWYITQLFNASAVRYQEDAQARADYIATLTPYVDDAGTKSYFTSTAEYITRPPEDPIQATSASALETLVAKYESEGVGALSEREREQLFGASVRYEELVEEAGGDPGAIVNALLPFFIDRVDNPNTLIGLAVRACRDGNRSQATTYFENALSKASGNGQRADFAYAMAARGCGSYDRVLQYDPGHGPTLYRQISNRASSIGRPSSVEGRAAYWCIADQFSRLAASGDSRIASQARRAASQYNRAGPSSQDYFFKGWTRGQSIRASSGGVSCTTTVR